MITSVLSISIQSGNTLVAIAIFLVTRSPHAGYAALALSLMSARRVTAITGPWWLDRGALPLAISIVWSLCLWEGVRLLRQRAAREAKTVILTRRILDLKEGEGEDDRIAED